jgi:hypothetical protein
MELKLEFELGDLGLEFQSFSVQAMATSIFPSPRRLSHDRPRSQASPIACSATRFSGVTTLLLSLPTSPPWPSCLPKFSSKTAGDGGEEKKKRKIQCVPILE